MTEQEARYRLRSVLDLYGSARRRKIQLESRLKKLRTEFGYPVSALSFSGSSGQKNGEAVPESLAILIREAEADLLAQTAEALRMMCLVESLIGLLPARSMERMILEYKHIDCLTWREICDAVPISRTPATRHYKKGLVRLAGMETVRKIIEESEVERRI